jgi:hypothetical protein
MGQPKIPSRNELRPNVWASTDLWGGSQAI